MIWEGKRGLGLSYFIASFTTGWARRGGSHLKIDGRGGHWGNTEMLELNRTQVQYLMDSVSEWFSIRLVWNQIDS
jgi:hypothetical protein